MDVTSEPPANDPDRADIPRARRDAITRHEAFGSCRLERLASIPEPGQCAIRRPPRAHGGHSKMGQAVVAAF